MFGVEYIKQCQRDHAREQELLETQPAVIWDQNEAYAFSLAQLQALPEFFTYRPYRWRKLPATFTVDTTCCYQHTGEISIADLQVEIAKAARKHKTVGLAVLDQGTGWVEVGVFKKQGH